MILSSMTRHVCKAQDTVDADFFSPHFTLKSEPKGQSKCNQSDLFYFMPHSESRTPKHLLEQCIWV